MKFYLLSNTSHSVRKYHFQNFTDDLLTTKPPLSLNWKDFLLFYQLELSFVMHEIISKDRYNQANSVTHKYSFSIQHCHHSINRNFARPFPSNQEEHRSAFSVEPFFRWFKRYKMNTDLLCYFYKQSIFFWNKIIFECCWPKNVSM